jgi:hypothetical protein
MVIIGYQRLLRLVDISTAIAVRQNTRMMKLGKSIYAAACSLPLAYMPPKRFAMTLSIDG